MVKNSFWLFNFVLKYISDSILLLEYRVALGSHIMYNITNNYSANNEAVLDIFYHSSIGFHSFQQYENQLTNSSNMHISNDNVR